MPSSLRVIFAMLTIVGFSLAVASAEDSTATSAEDSTATSAEDSAAASATGLGPGSDAAGPAVERALGFLQKDAAKWRDEHHCATCHHGAMTVWALHDARERGYAVEDRALAEAVDLSKKQFIRPFDPKKDLQPHWNVMPMAMVMMTYGARETELPGMTQADFDTIAVHLTMKQGEDGAWLTPPPANGPVPFFESQEVLTLWAYLALERYLPADEQSPSPARDSRQRAAEWLQKTPVADTTQAAALRLLMEVRAARSPEQVRPAIDRLLTRQNGDGGWSQTKDLASDAFATGQSLWVLKLAAVDRQRPEMQRAIALLLKTQRDDGSWPMIPRQTPERKASKNLQPIIYFGSAWATIGLLHATSR